MADDGLTENQKIIGAFTIQKDDACMRKEAALRSAKRSKNADKKEAFLKEAATWSRREAKWADEIKFRYDIGFGG